MSKADSSGAIWVLGATGRSGRGIARRLHGTGHPVVLAGRDAARLSVIAAELDGAKVVCGSFDSLLIQMRAAAPTVVVNTIGPFVRTSVLGSCLSQVAVVGAGLGRLIGATWADDSTISRVEMLGS